MRARACIRPCVRTYVRACVRAFVRACVRARVLVTHFHCRLIITSGLLEGDKTVYPKNHRNSPETAAPVPASMSSDLLRAKPKYYLPFIFVWYLGP